MTQTTTSRTAGGAPRPRPPVPLGSLPPGPGVYRFCDRRARVLYIGRTVNLRRRVASYWADLGSRGHLAPMVPRIAFVQALSCDSGHEAAWLERNLLERELPGWNRAPGGQEVPVYIRLDLRPRSVGLKVVRHAQPSSELRYFGPYLGRLRARLAVSAVHRVLPVACAAEGLHGWSRDLAKARGISPGDRAALAEAITAVLDRDPGAVAGLHAELVRRRDRAAEGLAFEFAARLQAEIQAAEWITSEQKVTLATPDNVDVHGWADGVLVSLAVRAGRMGIWRQRSCAQDSAAPLVAATPAAWVPFVQRNAELAARLGGLSWSGR